MSTQAPKSAKTTKPPNQNQPTSRSPSLSTHLAMVELKQRILISLSKLADRDTHQIALEDLHSITQSISPEALPLLLNSLYDSLSDSSNAKPSVKKESLHLLSLTCQSHRDLTLPHLTKIIAYVVKRLKDPDSSVKDACRDAIGVLSRLYLKSGSGGEGSGDGNGMGSMMGLFVRPLFEAMGEQNKGVQSGAAMCMAKMVECAAIDANDAGGNAVDGNVPTAAFQKLCPRICKLLNGQNFLAKAALLGVVTSLAQVGAIAQQGLEPLLESIHDCLGSTDWATRKAAADALSALALHSSSLIADGAVNSTMTVLEASHFDKIKPVRDSVTEALQLWKKIAGKAEDGVLDDQKASSRDGQHPEQAELLNKDLNPRDQKTESLARDSSSGSSLTMDSVSKGGSIPDKVVVILKRKAPALTDKNLNPEFFQKLERRESGDLPVEVVVPRRCINSSKLNNEEEPEPNDSESRGRSSRIGNSQSDDIHGSFNNKYQNLEREIAGKDSRTRAFDNDRLDVNHGESSGSRAGFSKSDGQSEGTFMNSKGNWLAIQRQLLQLERQQAHLMNMVQDFMGGSHDSMVTLEYRVKGLERIVEDMARDLSISSGRRGNNFPMGFEGSSNRPLGKYSGFSDYSSGKYNGRVRFGERFTQSDVTASGMRGRGPHSRSDVSDDWNIPTYGASRNGHINSRRAPGSGSLDVRSPKSEPESDQVGSRRAWDKGAGPVRLGEGPSARSVWQASKDEATLEAIRVAGEDNGLSRTARVAIPEMTAEALEDDCGGMQERDPIWTSWSNAMDAFKMGDMDTAYAEVVSTGDDFLLVKLMDRSGPVIDQLSNETAREVLHAITQFLLEHNLFDICLSWIQQLVEIVLENGPDTLGIPKELKKELLLNLHEASTEIDPPEDWEGVTPDQLLMQLASAWRIELQQFDR
ncbi:hypothetical protein P3X46_027156 [Hevea brasiliensis]|uniref:TOG domain-containing protein n=2 Tax=Hevea brasiliensis TaxID=3981 RepID=A0ABQ9L0L7_HEVBR|nr:microtubule-associated protein TORTIFOLIA1 isoform X2 [Hevea brasiliensis]KAJ9153748.1 hypothetical protein P3X46_027156 [Hevea brasiliensis]